MSFVKKLTKSVSKALPGAVAGAGAGFLVGGPVGALIGAGAGGLYTYSSAKAQEKQNKANKQAIADANAYDMYTWELANQYNDPVQQMERLRKAGLNPNLVYGSGNVTGNTTGVASSNGVANQTVFNSADSVAKALPLMQGFANLRNTNSQNQLLQYQMGQTQAQTESIMAQTRNLNNFLNNTGRSTYDPTLLKNAGAVGEIGKSIYDAGSSFGSWLAEKANNLFYGYGKGSSGGGAR